MRTFYLAAAGLILCLGAAEPGIAGTVSGSFVLDGQALQPTEVSAFRIRDRQQLDQQQTFVMLTREAPDRESIRQATDPYSRAINDPAASGDYLSLFIDAKGVVGLNAHVGGTQYLDSSGQIMGEKGRLVADCAQNSEQQVACKISTAKPVSTAGGKSWTLDVSFSTEVLQRDKGRPVAAGGEAPGQALVALQGALAGDDLAAIIALLSASEAEEYQADWRSPEENLQAAKDDYGRKLPSKPKVKSGEWMSDDQVLLDVQGYSEVFESDVLFSVQMQREGERWVVQHSQLVGFLD